jgi:FlgD Ig-like domain
MRHPVLLTSSRTVPHWSLIGMMVALSLAGASSPSGADDAATEFSASSNLASQRWTYGWTPTRSGAFTLFATKGTDAFGLDYWNYATNQALVSHNNTGVSKNIGNNTTIPAGGLTLFPGSTVQYTVVRWTAPASGTCTIAARFTRRSSNGYAAADAAVLHGTSVVFSRWLTNDVSNAVSMSATVPVLAGETIDFAVGPADGGNSSDMIGLDATVWLEPVVSASGPVILFGGQRFVACRGDSAFESIAYDPVNQRIASRDIIRTRCGTPVYQGTEEHPGLTWDSATGSYWQVTNNRVVQRWSATGGFLGAVFTVPLTFTVPGWGLDTLESVKGIAVDSSFVYLMDAGDPGTQGQIYSNEWFKFTRAGVPVKSSKLTDFHAHLDLSPDALVDDIVYSPFSSPVYPGKFLIALEHSGIQVIDAEGNFVDKFRWSDPGVPAGARLSAFAGLGLDPVDGNLYLADNDGTASQIWTRLPGTGPTYYAIGTGSNQPYLQYPNPGCNRALWKAPAASGGLGFGCSFRTANQTVYSVDFGSGDVSRFDPATGAGGRVALTGAYSIWGVAYDTERDVVYGGVEYGGPGSISIVVIDPLSGAASPLPNPVGQYTRDLAFDPIDQKLYGVASLVGGPNLMRIDRDTGAGTVVGPTADVTGIGCDAVSGRLIAIQNSGGASNATLWSIDPANGASTLIATLPHNTAWEGLTVVPVGAPPPVSVELEVPGAELSSLRVVPNPTRGTVTLDFRLPAEALVEAAVYDVAGRKVRAIGRGRFAAGNHSMTWDGRDAAGRALPSGVYFVRLDRGGESLVTRMVRIE